MKRKPITPLLLLASLCVMAGTNPCFAQTAQQHFTSGYVKYVKGDYAGAVADYNRAIQLDAKDRNDCGNSGRCPSTAGLAGTG